MYTNPSFPIGQGQENLMLEDPIPRTYRFFINYPNEFEGPIVKTFDIVPYPQFQRLRHLILVVYINLNYNRYLFYDWFSNVDLRKPSSHIVIYDPAVHIRETHPIIYQDNIPI